MASIDPSFSLAKRVHCLSNIDKDTWPLIILANFRKSSKDKLVELLRPRSSELINGFPPRDKIQTWTPSTSVLASMAQQGPCRDSQANLYALAILAYQSGHSRFLVADKLSNRQLSIKLHEDSTFMLSVVLIRVFEDLASSGGHLAVSARRALCCGEPIELMFSIFDQHTHSVGNPDSHLREYFQSRDKCPGSRLHDPERPVLSFNAKTSVERESQLQAIYAALPRLPVELVMDIVARTGAAQIPETVSWKDYPCEHHLVIFLLFPATPDQIRETTAAIEDAVVNHRQVAEWNPFERFETQTFELIPWEKHRIRCRRSLMEFWLFYHSRTLAFSHRRPLLHLMLEPMAHTSDQCFGTISSSIASVAIAWRSPLNEVVRRLDEPCSMFSTKIEKIYNPDDPFYYRSHQWQTAGYYATRWLPVVLLTNHLSEEQELEIREAIGLGCRETEMAIEPWKSGPAGDIDGTVQDIWEIALRVEKAFFQPESVYYFVCIDQQSAVDSTVLFVTLDTFSTGTARRKWAQLRDLPSPKLQGITLRRVPDFGLWTRCRIEGRDHGWMDSYSQKHFIRPDLRPHGRPKYRDSYVDGNGNAVTLEDDIDPEEQEDTCC